MIDSFYFLFTDSFCMLQFWFTLATWASTTMGFVWTRIDNKFIIFSLFFVISMCEVTTAHFATSMTVTPSCHVLVLNLPGRYFLGVIHLLTVYLVVLINCKYYNASFCIMQVYSSRNITRDWIIARHSTYPCIGMHNLNCYKQKTYV